MKPRTHRILIVAFFAYVAGLLSIPVTIPPAHAEDIDIFIRNPTEGAGGRPNVLIMLDNTSNWSSTDTSDPDSKARFENVRSALATTVGTLTDQFNVGLMLFNETGSNNPAPDGGVMRAGVRRLSNADGYKEKFKNLVGNLQGNEDKGNNTNVGLAFYEAYLYFSGQQAYAGANKIKRDRPGNCAVSASDPACASGLGTTGNQAEDNPSLVHSDAVWKTTQKPDYSEGGPNALKDSTVTSKYNSPITDACGKNYIIFISNGVVQENASTIQAATDFLAAATPPGDINEIRISAPDDPALSKNVADEWSRYLFKNDIMPDEVNFPGKQNVTTYTVEVGPITTGNGPAWTSMMKSIAREGGSGDTGYFPVVGANGGASIAEALNKIFTEILAKDSVFASASLPASVNVRGAFLNQVYMGMFRPDANASPRWPGNLKQYALAVRKVTDANGNQQDEVFLGDKNSPPLPVENATAGADVGEAQGFINPDAVSFWTTNESPGFWDLTFYPDVKTAKFPTSTSDVPDGPFVEKGGAAQRLRTVLATNVNLRNVYTCLGCGSGASLAGDSANHFTTANTAIDPLLFGISAPHTVGSLDRVRDETGTVIATVPNHGFAENQQVSIKGATPGDYNGDFFVTSVTTNTFRYTLTGTPPVRPATTGSAASGQTLKASKPGATQTVSGFSRTGSTVTVTTPAAHGFANGASVAIAGVSSSEGGDVYNSTFTISTAGPTSTQFTFTVPTTPVTPPTSVAGATATANGVTRTISSVVRTTTGAGTTVTVTTASNFLNGQPNNGCVVIANVTPADYNNGSDPCVNPTQFYYSKTSNTVFTYLLPASRIGPTASPTLGSITAALADTRNIVSISRSGEDSLGIATVTVNTDPAQAVHAFAAGEQVTISGAAQSEYNGTFTVVTSNPAGRTFTYTIAIQPVSPATVNTSGGFTEITATGASGIDKDDLVNWVRGANSGLDKDNPIDEKTRVRGYLHADVLHSRPIVINYNRNTPPDGSDVVVYYGSNGGMIHAVKGGQADSDGLEKWSFVPSEFYERFARLYLESPVISTAVPRTYFADGPVSANAEYVTDGGGIERLTGTGAKAQIFAGMRRGGRFYYALDVTNPDAPLFNWKIDPATDGFSELGQSWSEAKVRKLMVSYPPASAPAVRKVLIFGAGYDAPANDPTTQGTATMGRGIYVVDAASGAPIWFAGPVQPVNFPTDAVYFPVNIQHAIPADLAVINSDLDSAGIDDRVYAADTGGNIWRANIFDPDPAKWTVGQIAALGGSGANARKFLFAPDVVPLDANNDAVLIGSGDREHPFETGVTDRYYMIKDAHGMLDLPGTPATTADLLDLTSASPEPNAANKSDIAADLAGKSGWFFDLRTGEKVVTGTTTLAGVSVFSTNIPASQTPKGQCAPLGRAFIYAVNFRDATAALFKLSGVDSRFGEAATGGFLTTATSTVVPINDPVTGQEKYHEVVIVFPQTLKPGATEVGRRYRVFWNLSVDN
jgi:type IV pilus assembly protein PilY1